MARDADEPLDYTFHPGKKSTYEQQKPPSASELGSEQIPTSTDIDSESIPIQVDSPALGRAPEILISPPTPPLQKQRKTSAEGHDQIVQQLLEEVADVNAQGRYYGSTLQAAKGKEVMYYCCHCGNGPMRWEKFRYCQSCHKRQCRNCKVTRV